MMLMVLVIWWETGQEWCTFSGEKLLQCLLEIYMIPVLGDTPRQHLSSVNCTNAVEACATHCLNFFSMGILMQAAGGGGIMMIHETGWKEGEADKIKDHASGCCGKHMLEAIRACWPAEKLPTQKKLFNGCFSKLCTTQCSLVPLTFAIVSQ